MGERLGVPPGRRVVVEGIFDPADDPVVDVPTEPGSDGFVVLYTGTLAARYGIVDLLKAFSALDRPDAVLWICGEGDARDQVEAMVRRDPRVRYFGQVPRARALALQRQASVLVNPRRPEGEFTKYSFPSKTMEYLASGRPIIMHDLPGIPPEYRDHLILPPTPDNDGLAAALREAASRPFDSLRDRGAAGRAFVLAQKSPQAQVARILDHWRAIGRD
jgi:glycosyltransferase involved in cell wall biosynthesis